MDLQHRLEQFYYREARLLDGRHFKEWQKLVAQDIRYVIPARWVPVAADADRDTDRYHEIENELSNDSENLLREDNYLTLSLRTSRAVYKHAAAENPPARTRRLITNVEILSTVADDTVEALSNFMLIFNRHDSDHFIYSGQRQDLLRPDQAGFSIVRRRVILDSKQIATPGVGLIF